MHVKNENEHMKFTNPLFFLREYDGAEYRQQLLILQPNFPQPLPLLHLSLKTPQSVNYPAERVE